MPGLNLLIRIPAGDYLTTFAGLDYKRLRPELKSSFNAEAEGKIGSLSAFANIKIKTEPVSLSLMGVYGQNACDLMMIGGYAISEISGLNEEDKTYTNINTASFWADLSTNGKRVMFGLFTGFTSNLGAGEIITGSVYGRGNNIDHIVRISPRITVTDGSLSFAAEVENTVAAYGTMQNTGKVINTNSVNNVRVLLSAVYRF